MTAAKCYFLASVFVRLWIVCNISLGFVYVDKVLLLTASCSLLSILEAKVIFIISRCKDRDVIVLPLHCNLSSCKLQESKQVFPLSPFLTSMERRTKQRPLAIKSCPLLRTLDHYSSRLQSKSRLFNTNLLCFRLQWTNSFTRFDFSNKRWVTLLLLLDADVCNKSVPYRRQMSCVFGERSIV